MMRKLLSIGLLAAVVALASCTKVQEGIDPSAAPADMSGQQVSITITTQAPRQQVGVMALDENYGLANMRVYLIISRKDNGTLVDVQTEEGKSMASGLSFQARLAHSVEYVIACWADYDKLVSPTMYQVEAIEGANSATVSMLGTTGSDDNTLVLGACTNQHDAFFGRVEYAIDPRNPQPVALVLSRAMAVLKMDARDYSQDIGVASYSVKITDGLDTKMDLLTGALTGKKAVEIQNEVKVDDIGGAHSEMGFHYLFPSTIPVGEMTFAFYKEDKTVIKTFDIKNVPLTANKMTNIKGDLLTPSTP